MTRNVLIMCGAEGAAEYAAALAARSGSDVGLVHTCCDPSRLKTSGGRIEEDREYGGRMLSAFDEPLAVGSAVAQLAGHADAVVIDRLDDWAGRLVAHYEADAEAIAAELNALRSVMKARLLDLFLIMRVPGAAPGAAAELARRILEDVDRLCDVVVEAADGTSRVVRGDLPR